MLVVVFMYTSFLQEKIVNQESNDQSDGQLTEDQSFDSFDTDDRNQDRHDSFHLELQEQQDGKQELLL